MQAMIVTSNRIPVVRMIRRNSTSDALINDTEGTAIIEESRIIGVITRESILTSSII